MSKRLPSREEQGIPEQPSLSGRLGDAEVCKVCSWGRADVLQQRWGVWKWKGEGDVPR